MKAAKVHPSTCLLTFYVLSWRCVSSHWVRLSSPGFQWEQLLRPSAAVTGIPPVTRVHFSCSRCVTDWGFWLLRLSTRQLMLVEGCHPLFIKGKWCLVAWRSCGVSVLYYTSVVWFLRGADSGGCLQCQPLVTRKGYPKRGWLAQRNVLQPYMLIVWFLLS